MWEFLFSANILIFENFVPKFQIFLIFSANFAHFTQISHCFTSFSACGFWHLCKIQILIYGSARGNISLVFVCVRPLTSLSMWHSDSCAIVKLKCCLTFMLILCCWVSYNMASWYQSCLTLQQSKFVVGGKVTTLSQKYDLQLC